MRLVPEAIRSGDRASVSGVKERGETCDGSRLAEPGINRNSSEIEREIEADAERSLDIDFGIEDLFHEPLARVDRQATS